MSVDPDSDAGWFRRHKKHEAQVADWLAARRNYTWRSMGEFHPIDVYFLKDDIIHSLVEIRTRRNLWVRQERFVLMDLDKWFSLMQAEIALHLPSFYVVAARDGVWYVRVGALEVQDFRIVLRGRRDRPHMPNDVCPVLEIPAAKFQCLDEWVGWYTPEATDPQPPSAEEIRW